MDMDMFIAVVSCLKTVIFDNVVTEVIDVMFEMIGVQQMLRRIGYRVAAMLIFLFFVVR